MRAEAAEQFFMQQSCLPAFGVKVRQATVLHSACLAVQQTTQTVLCTRPSYTRVNLCALIIPDK